MKPAPTRKRSGAGRERQVECLDAINLHRKNAGVLAGLLEKCEHEEIDGALVAEAGEMIREELEQVRDWTSRLEEELSSK